MSPPALSFHFGIALNLLLAAAWPANAPAQPSRESSRIESPNGGAATGSKPTSRRRADAVNLPPVDQSGRFSAMDAVRGAGGSAPAVRFHSKDEEEEDSEPREARPGKRMAREPWLSPSGERLAAIVGDRYLTKSDLDARVALAVKQDDPIKNADPQLRRELEYERQLKYANEIMQDWVMNTTLALEAQREGLKVTEQEIQESLSKLSSQTPGGGAQVNQQMRMVGVPEAQLRAEARDALLVEKLIMAVVREYDEAVYQRIFEAEPATFLIPPRVHAFHMFRQIPPGAPEKEIKEAQKQLEKFRRDLAQKSPNLEALVKLTDKDKRLAIGDMGWIQADALIPPELHAALFGLNPGTTSEVFRSASGLHVVRILEREEGSGDDFASAKPQIENYLFGRTKPAVYNVVKARYTIRMNTGGLNRWREIADQNLPGTAATDRRPRTRDIPDQAPSPAKAAPAPAPAPAKPRAKATPRAAAPVVDLPE